MTFNQELNDGTWMALGVFALTPERKGVIQLFAVSEKS